MDKDAPASRPSNSESVSEAIGKKTNLIRRLVRCDWSQDRFAEGCSASPGLPEGCTPHRARKLKASRKPPLELAQGGHGSA